MISKLNFNITDTHDLKTLGILDTSWYNPDIKIESPTIEVLPPGFSQAVSPFFMQKALNVYNSNSLGITHFGNPLVDLPDGIWKVKYSICPNDKLFIERFFLKTDLIQCKFDQVFLNLDLQNMFSEQESQKRQKLKEIDLYIQGAIAAANKQNPKLSIDLYNTANKLIKVF